MKNIAITSLVTSFYYVLLMKTTSVPDRFWFNEDFSEFLPYKNGHITIYTDRYKLLWSQVLTKNYPASLRVSMVTWRWVLNH